jgi:hypothetical protein
LEQEGSFQEQLKDDIMERRRLKQVNTGLNAQLQQARLKCGNKVEGGTSETAAMTIDQKLRDTGVSTELCWRWYTTGQ